MRIAMLTNNYKPFVGGVPISVERQAKELVKMGHQVTVFAPEHSGAYNTREAEKKETEEGQERIIRFRTSRRRMENGLVYPKVINWEILQVFKEEQFDCIHVHHPMFTGFTALYLGKKYSLPVIYTYHTKYEDYLHYVRPFQNMEKRGAITSEVFRFGKERAVPGYMRWFTNQCDMVLAPTESIRKNMLGNGTETPVAIFPTGLEDSFYEGNSKRSEEIRKEYTTGESHLFCTVSRLEEEKNPGFILQGIAELKRKLKKPFKVLLIGEGSMKSKLEKMATDLDILKETVFVGNIENDEVKYYLGACDLFLFASKSETQGIVLAEALAAGLPVIAVKATGVEDIIMDGKNGYTTEEDVNQWIGKIVLALGKDAHKRLKRESRESAEAFRASKLAVFEETLYTQCIKEKEEKVYENEANRTKHSKSYIFRLFKAS